MYARAIHSARTRLPVARWVCALWLLALGGAAAAEDREPAVEFTKLKPYRPIENQAALKANWSVDGDCRVEAGRALRGVRCLPGKDAIGPTARLTSKFALADGAKLTVEYVTSRRNVTFEIGGERIVLRGTTPTIPVVVPNPTNPKRMVMKHVEIDEQNAVVFELKGDTISYARSVNGGPPDKNTIQLPPDRAGVPATITVSAERMPGVVGQAAGAKVQDLLITKFVVQGKVHPPATSK